MDINTIQSVCVFMLMSYIVNLCKDETMNMYIYMRIMVPDLVMLVLI